MEPAIKTDGTVIELQMGTYRTKPGSMDWYVNKSMNETGNRKLDNLIRVHDATRC